MSHSTHPSAGLFISFEGVDGAGKSSHIDALAQAFTAQGRQVLRTREPGGTPLAEKLRTLLLHDSMDPLSEALLVFAARRDHLVQVITPALARGEVVLCDRFTDATFAYQGGGRGFDLAMLTTLEHMVQTGLPPTPERLCEPDVTLWFDLPVAVAAQRLAGARSPDRFEAQSQAFLSACPLLMQRVPHRHRSALCVLMPPKAWLTWRSNCSRRCASGAG